MTDIITAFTTALGTVQGDVISVLSAIVPVAIAVAGMTWVARKAFGWFKSMAK